MGAVELLVVALLLGAVLATGAAVIFGVLLARRGAARAEQGRAVVPGRPSSAPVSWSGEHTREAVLHRRLARAMEGLADQRSLVDEDLGVMELRIELEQHALATDERLVAAARLPDDRRDPALDRIEEAVRVIETASADLTDRHRRADATADDVALAELARRIRGTTGTG